MFFVIRSYCFLFFFFYLVVYSFCFVFYCFLVSKTFFFNFCTLRILLRLFPYPVLCLYTPPPLLSSQSVSFALRFTRLPLRLHLRHHHHHFRNRMASRRMLSLELKAFHSRNAFFSNPLFLTNFCLLLLVFYFFFLFNPSFLPSLIPTAFPFIFFMHPVLFHCDCVIVLF